MIEIRNGRIYFYNTLKQDLKTQDFMCLSAYVCPYCKNILSAYYVDHFISESLKEYMEKDSMKYAYEFGETDGGQWMSLQEHTHRELCRWEVVGSLTRGVQNCVDAFIQTHDVKTEKRRELIQAITDGTIEGFTLIKDEIGTDLPMLVYNESTLLNSTGLDFEVRLELKENVGKAIDSKLSTGLQSFKMEFGTCTHCGKAPATRMPLKLCQKCSDELGAMPPDSQQRRDWLKQGVQ